MSAVKTKKQHTKKCVIKRRHKFDNYKNCLEATQLDKIYLENNKISIGSLNNCHKEYIKNNKLILKTQQRFISKTHNLFTKKINKIALRSNDDKRIQTNDLIGTYTYRTSKALISEKEEIKYNKRIQK